MGSRADRVLWPVNPVHRVRHATPQTPAVELLESGNLRPFPHFPTRHRNASTQGTRLRQCASADGALGGMTRFINGISTNAATKQTIIAINVSANACVCASRNVS